MLQKSSIKMTGIKHKLQQVTTMLAMAALTMVVAVETTAEMVEAMAVIDSRHPIKDKKIVIQTRFKFFIQKSIANYKL